MVIADMQNDLGKDTLTTMSHAPYAPAGLSLYTWMTKDSHPGKEEDQVAFIRSDLRRMTKNYLRERCNSTI